MILKAQDLSFSFGRKRIIDSLDIALNRGDMAAVLGPNGAGKSTLLRLLCGLLEPESGQVSLDGEPLATYSERERALHISAVFPGIHRQAAFTVEELVEMGRAAHMPFWGGADKGDCKAIEDAIKAANLKHLRKRQLSQLSSGELQRVLIAMALSQESPVILLDEPTAFLDLKHQIDILGLLSGLNRDKARTILCVTHDINLAARFFKKIFLMKSGKIKYWGDVEKVLTPSNIKDVFDVDVNVGRDPEGNISLSIKS